MGQPERAAASADRALRLNPTYPAFYPTPWPGLLPGNRPDDAIRVIESLPSEQRNAIINMPMAGSYAMLGPGDEQPRPRRRCGAATRASRSRRPSRPAGSSPATRSGGVVDALRKAGLSVCRRRLRARRAAGREPAARVRGRSAKARPSSPEPHVALPWSRDRVAFGLPRSSRGVPPVCIYPLGSAAGRFFELGLAQYPLADRIARSLEAGEVMARLVIDFSPELLVRGELVADGKPPLVLFTVDGRGKASV